MEDVLKKEKKCLDMLIHKRTNDKLDLIKTKNVCSAKSLLRKWKDKYDLEKSICKSHTNRRLASKVSKLNGMKQTVHFENGQEIWKDISPVQEEIMHANKWNTISYREMHIKAMMSELGKMAHTCSPSTWEAKVGGSQNWG
jgi:hypothetical protein